MAGGTPKLSAVLLEFKRKNKRLTSSPGRLSGDNGRGRIEIKKNGLTIYLGLDGRQLAGRYPTFARYTAYPVEYPRRFYHSRRVKYENIQMRRNILDNVPSLSRGLRRAIPSEHVVSRFGRIPDTFLFRVLSQPPLKWIFAVDG